MQTNTQYLLGKLAEEASELAQIAIKAQQFGLHEVFGEQGDNPLSNVQRIENEFNDVIGIVDMLNREARVGIDEDPDKILAKRHKVNKWRNYAREQGMVE